VQERPDVKTQGAKAKSSVAAKDTRGRRHTNSRAERVLDFWLRPDHGANDAAHLWSRWFIPDPEFDRLCKAVFLKSYRDAAFGRLDKWKKTSRTCLALVLLLDQFPRNMFRDTARAFATDAKARIVSRHAVTCGFDREVSPVMRMFFYLPFEHSEHLHDQMESVRLALILAEEYGGSAEAAAIRESAQWHFQTIRRFGRFPGRNEALGRQSTTEEIEFLKHQHLRGWGPPDSLLGQ
jgi:uncharacterized protein (DUF924 family)